MNFTFKKQAGETGLARISNPYPTTDIKLKKKVIGHIYPPSYWRNNSTWSISIAVEIPPKDNPNCSWSWKKVKPRFSSEEDARQWVKEKLEKVIVKYGFTLHSFED